MSSSFAELERALSSVPGIVAASVTVTEGTGRARLRLRLAPGEDPDAIAWAVSATLRERFGIALDPDTIRPRLDTAEPRTGPDHGGDAHAVTLGPTPVPADDDHDVPVGPSPGGRDVDPAQLASRLAGSSSRRVRAAIRDLVTRQGDRDVEVVATLEIGGKVGRSTARSVPTRRGVWRAVAEATVGALAQLTGDHLHAGIDRVVVHSGDDSPMATVVVTVSSDRGEETLLGASLLRDDPEAAVMRATLDALNRRVEPWLPAVPAG